MRVLSVLLFFLNVTACSSYEHSLNGVWEPKVHNQTGIDVNEQLEIKGDTCILRAILPDSTMESYSKLRVIDTVSLVYEFCFTYMDNIELECFRIKQKERNVLELWNSRNNEVVVTYHRRQ
jgi:hypothetical protein